MLETLKLLSESNIVGALMKLLNKKWRHTKRIEVGNNQRVRATCWDVIKCERNLTELHAEEEKNTRKL